MTTIEHGPDCRPEDMSEPDEEGIRDCFRCGLWETRYYSDGERDVKYQSSLACGAVRHLKPPYAILGCQRGCVTECARLLRGVRKD